MRERGCQAGLAPRAIPPVKVDCCCEQRDKTMTVEQLARILWADQYYVQHDLDALAQTAATGYREGQVTREQYLFTQDLVKALRDINRREDFAVCRRRCLYDGPHPANITEADGAEVEPKCQRDGRRHQRPRASGLKAD